MESAVDLQLVRLQGKTYRQLQQMAKSMDLPSNLKKVYLIELILAKKYKTETDVVSIIDRAHQERLQLSKTSKKYRKKKIKFQVDAQRITETRNSVCDSPPITETPKRPSDLQLSPEILPNPLVPMNRKRKLMHSITLNQRSNTAGVAVSASDRVLRSFNLKTVKPNYALMNNDVHELKTQCCANTETKFKITPKGGIKTKTKCYVRKSASIVSDRPNSVLKWQYAIAITHNEDAVGSEVPAKRRRMLSGIYPLQPEETTPRNRSTIQSVSLRRNDGSYTKINALVQKSNLPKNNNYNIKRQQITIQELINELDANAAEVMTNSNNNYLNIQYPNISGVNPTSDSYTSSIYDQRFINNYKESEDYYSWCDAQPVDYEQKIREEQMKCQRLKAVREPLPNISDVFTRFNYMDRGVMQPIYVQVSSELGNVPNYPAYENYSTKNSLLETVYNIRTNAPLPIVANTTSVFATQTMTTAAELQASAGLAADAYVTSPGPDNDPYPDVDVRLRDFLQLQSSRSHTDCSSLSSIDTMDTIPEMVEDALEIISQDGDYMERMGMSAHMQCVFCGWAGPTIMLECHIRKDHAVSIMKQYKRDWNITYTLGSLVQCGVWLHRVVEHDSELYMLSAKYEDPGCFLATLCSLSPGPEPKEKFVTITLYNKITGEPFSWTGQIQLPPKSPYDPNPNCFKIDIAKLELLPNSANLKLVNGELVTQSPNKVVVGHPALNDIHIIMFIKIYD